MHACRAGSTLFSAFHAESGIPCRGAWAMCPGRSRTGTLTLPRWPGFHTRARTMAYRYLYRGPGALPRQVIVDRLSRGGRDLHVPAQYPVLPALCRGVRGSSPRASTGCYRLSCRGATGATRPGAARFTLHPTPTPPGILRHLAGAAPLGAPPGQRDDTSGPFAPGRTWPQILRAGARVL